LIFVSDAGAPLPDVTKIGIDSIENDLRTFNLLYAQIGKLRGVLMSDKFENTDNITNGAWWKLGNLATYFKMADTTQLVNYPFINLNESFPKIDTIVDTECCALIEQFRTDLNCLGPEECKIIENTGYLLAAYRFRMYCADKLGVKINIAFHWDGKYMNPKDIKHYLQHSDNAVLCDLLHSLRIEVKKKTDLLVRTQVNPPVTDTTVTVTVDVTVEKDTKGKAPDKKSKTTEETDKKEKKSKKEKTVKKDDKRSSVEIKKDKSSSVEIKKEDTEKVDKTDKTEKKDPKDKDSKKDTTVDTKDGKKRQFNRRSKG